MVGGGVLGVEPSSACSMRGGGKNQDLISVQSNITSSKSPQHVLCAIEFPSKVHDSMMIRKPVAFQHGSSFVAFSSIKH